MHFERHTTTSGLLLEASNNAWSSVERCLECCTNSVRMRTEWLPNTVRTS